MSKEAFKAMIKGRVQGVGYRASVHKEATKLGIKGYIRGVSGNELEVVAEGDKDSLKKLSEYLEVGPKGAEVREFSEEEIEPTDDFIRFAIKY